MCSPKKAMFLKERYEREARHYSVYDSFTPNYKQQVLSGKFYSKHERPILSEADPEIVRQINKFKYETPPQKYPWPQTENQWYGFFSAPLIEMDRKDKRFYHPKITTETMRHDMKLKADDIACHKIRFQGIPFKLT